MDKKKGFHTMAFVVRVAVAVVLASVSLTLTGCGQQMARIEEGQLKLQALVQLNTQQIGAFGMRTEQNQQGLQDALENMRTSTQALAADIAAVAGERAKLQNIVQANNLQMTDKIAVIEQAQQHLQGGIEDVRSRTQKVAADITGLGDKQARLEAITENNSRTLVSKVAEIEQNHDKLRAEIKNVQAGTETVAADLAAVAEAQAKLKLMVQSDNRQMAGKVTAVEQNQQKRQTEIEGVKNDLRKASAGVGALEENLSKLQELLRDDTRNLADIIGVVGQGQIEFEEETQRDVRGLAESMSLLEQNQGKLQKQVQEVQRNTEVMIGRIMTTLDQLKARAPQTGSAKEAKTTKTRASVSEVKEQD